jgi:phosphatidylglycerol lysyltransferase
MLFVIALFVIHHKLRQYQFHDILNQVRQTPTLSLLLAAMLTFFNYVTLTGYDALGLRYIHTQIHYTRLAVASFVGYAFSMNTTILGGSAARYRIYSSLGVSTASVARLVIFNATTFWLGFFTVSAVSFLLHPQHIPQVLGLPFLSVRPIGIVLGALVSAYLVLVLSARRPLKIRDWEIEVPPLTLSLGQILISSLDWLLAAGILYVLMPQSMTLNYPKFLSIYLLAQITGLVSSVPGGLGVFETVILLLTSGFGEPATIMGSLLLYRVIYYFLPLTAASIMLGLNEFLTQRHIVIRAGEILSRIGKMAVPQIFAFTTFIAGTVLLFSGSLPTAKGRMAILRDLLPLPAIELSHFLGSVAGAGLIILARGLQRRINAGYHVTVALLLAGIVFSLLKGLDYEEAIILAVMLLAFLPCRKEFYRRGSLLEERFSPGWMISIAAVAACSVWLVMFSYKHVDYSHHLWWRFAFEADAPRSLRAVAAVIIVFLFYLLARLSLPASAASVTQDESAQMEAIEKIVRSNPRTYAWLALLGDKTFLVDKSQGAFIMYAVQGRSWVAMGDPVGPEDKWQDLIWDFRELSDRYTGWPVFYQVEKDHLDFYLDLGLTFLKLGEEGCVMLSEFTLSGSANSGLRHSLNKISKQNYQFSIVECPKVPDILPALREVSQQWLETKKTREKRFSLGWFNPPYLSKTPIAVIRQDDRITAFANIIASANKEEISVDVMRFLPSSPEGIMDYLFIELMVWAKEQGYQWFNLGMAPLSGIENRTLAPLWSHAGAFIFRYGEHFYNFQGLRQYKEKFHPHWQPKYIACPRGFMLPRILANVAVLISGGIKGVVSK